MALIDTQTFPLTRQRLTAALRLIPQQADIFSGEKMREARARFISGKNVLSSIRGWLQAANVVKRDGRSYFLTDFGKSLAGNDLRMSRAASWWCFHLSVCFSQRCEPYRSFFWILGERPDWVIFDHALIEKVSAVVAESSGLDVADASIEKNLEGVVKMFMGDSPLTDLGLIETRKEAGKLMIRLSEAIVQDQAIVFALALARHRHYPSAITINFSELIDIGLNHFLCMSVNMLRRRLREISRIRSWQASLAFVEGKDLDSIQFGDDLSPAKTLLRLLQETEDTWI